MKRYLCLVLAVVMVLSQFAAVSAFDDNFFYVATNGSDANRGTIASPFATLNKAVEAASRAGGGNIIVRAGEYKLGDTIELGETSGNIAIYGDGDVTFSGGTKIPYSAFSKVTDKKILERVIEQSGKDALMSADLKALGVEEIIGMRPQGYVPNSMDNKVLWDEVRYRAYNTFMPDGTLRGFAATLTYNDDYLKIAEYPNDGYAYTQSVVKGRSGEDVSVKYTIFGDRWKNWTEAKNIYGYGYYYFDWCYVVAPVTIDEDGVFTSYVGYADIATNRRVRFQNLLEEIDVPGEYYADEETGILYIYLPEGFKEGEYLTYAPHSKDVFKLDGAKNITIQGIRFEGTTENVIEGKNSNNIHINDCEFTAIGDNVLDLFNTSNVIVENSYFHDIGSTGIMFEECGDRQNLVPSGNKVVNCHFESFSKYRLTYAPAIQSRLDVGTLISHCEFNDSPHAAILYLGNDTVIEYCEFYDLCKDTSDAGIVYTGKCYNAWGNKIRYNYFHDCSMAEGTNTGMSMFSVYLDDCHSQTDVFGNVFYKISAVGHFGGGRNCSFENNLLIDNPRSFAVDNRGTFWVNSSVEGGMIPAMELADTVDWHTDVWKEKYPELMNLKEDEPGIPKYNVIRNNVRFKTPEFGMNEDYIKYGIYEESLEINDRMAFVKYGEDFTLSENSIIFEQLPDFKQIPFKEIGRYEYEKPEIPAPSVADDSISVVINGTVIDFADVEPRIINNRTMVPLRAIFEALGAEVSWDDKTKTVTAVREGVTIKMTIGKDSFTRNDESVVLDSPATIVDSRTLVPVRAIAESFGATVGWIAESKTVTIVSSDTVIEEYAENAETTEEIEK